MSEALLWANYCLSAAIAFAAVRFRGWRVTSAMLLGTIATLTIWLLVSLAGGASLDDPWLETGLIVNGSFSLIFAGVGAAVALGVAGSNRR